MTIHMKAAVNTLGGWTVCVCMCCKNPPPILLLQCSAFLNNFLWRVEQQRSAVQQANKNEVKNKGVFQGDCFFLFHSFACLCVHECYLYVGDYVCGEECVAELGNRSGLPNTH